MSSFTQSLSDAVMERFAYIFQVMAQHTDTHTHRKTHTQTQVLSDAMMERFAYIFQVCVYMTTVHTEADAQTHIRTHTRAGISDAGMERFAYIFQVHTHTNKVIHTHVQPYAARPLEQMCKA